MKDAPIYPITQPMRPLYHASYVHNAVYVPALGNFDPTQRLAERSRRLSEASGH
jgi:peptide/nickel transport system substrate-binding protein